MLALLPDDGCSCRRCGRLGYGSSVRAKRWRWWLLSFALLLGLHSVLSDAAGVALLPRLVEDLEPRHPWESSWSICMHVLRGNYTVLLAFSPRFLL